MFNFDKASSVVFFSVISSRIEELTESLDEREKMKQVVKEKEEKIETLNKSFDEKDKLLQELESRFVRPTLENVIKEKRQIENQKLAFT